MQSLEAAIDLLFGSGTELTVLQMVCRAVVIFAAGLLFMRPSGPDAGSASLRGTG